MAYINVKIYQGDDIRRIRFPDNALYADLMTSVQNAFGKPGSITWTDEDGDAVSVRTDADWGEAVRAFGDNVIKLNFAPDVVIPANTVEATPIPASSVPSFEIEEEDNLPGTPDEQKLPNNSKLILSEMHCSDTLKKEDNLPGTSNGQDLPNDRKLILTEIPCTDASQETETKLPKSTMSVHKEVTDTNSGADVPVSSTNASTTAPQSGSTVDKQKLLKPRCPVHHGIECDASGEKPITGTRYHLIHYNYDVNEAEFKKLSKKEQALFEAISYPGATPEPVGETTVPLIQKMMETHKTARADIDGKIRQRSIVAFIPPGKVLPDGDAAIGSFGPGVVQIQHALIAIGAMSPSAIRFREGIIGPRTSRAIQEYKEGEGIPSDPYHYGTYTNAVRDSLLGRIDALVDNKAATTEQEKLQREHGKVAATACKESSVVNAADTQKEGSQADQSKQDSEDIISGERWEEEQKVLIDMGFLDTTKNCSLLDRHNGAMPFVIAALV